MNHGLFFLVAGPAGAGKTTLLKPLVASEPNLVKAVSVTTRAPRTEEVDGVSYHFWDDARFEDAVQNGEFLEHAYVHKVGRYGTLAQFVIEKLDAGVDVVKDIDVQGVEQIVANPLMKGRVVTIFILPPSHNEMVERLKRRASEDETTFKNRLRSAEDELKRVSEYDYAVVNDDVETALKELKAIYLAEHCRTGRRMQGK